jgi:hypothetical protein
VRSNERIVLNQFPVVREGKVLQTLLTALAILIAVGSLIFSGLQTRILAKQTAVLTVTSKLSYQFQVITQLEQILFEIADDADSHAHAWSQGSTMNRRPEVAVEALLDVLASAKGATPQLPGFEKYEPDWDSYISFTLENGPGVRAKLLAHPDWWPELDSFARRIRDEQQSGAHTNGRLADNTFVQAVQILGRPRSVKQLKRLPVNLWQRIMLIIPQCFRSPAGFPSKHGIGDGAPQSDAKPAPYTRPTSHR